MQVGYGWIQDPHCENVGRSYWKWNFARSNVQKLLDVKFIFGHCILPFLELVHMLFKYAKGLRYVYIYDFVEAIKMFMSKFYEVYNDHEWKFQCIPYVLLIGKHDRLPLVFIKSPTIHDDWCVIRFNNCTIVDHWNSWNQTNGDCLTHEVSFSRICGFI